MLVSSAHKKLVLNLRNPARVTTVIPTAKVLQHNGNVLIAVPHKVHETRVLRNLGIKAPSPILHHYNWPGRFKPFDAQRRTAAFLTMHDMAFVLNDMGTGKTLAALWAFDYLRTQGLASKAMVVSPLSTLERTWADEVFMHFPHLSVGVVYGDKARRQKVLAGDYDIYLINHDGVDVVCKEIIAKKEIDTFIVDEIAAFRNASTDRWKALRKATTGRTRIWGMTGTPTPNSPLDAWAQCRLVVPGRVAPYMGRFRDSVLKQAGPFKWVPREGANDIVADAMRPSIRFTRDQCVDLPPVVYVDRSVVLSPEQAKAYKEMHSTLRMDFQNQQITAVNEAVKMSKLVQIACGVVYDAQGNEIALPNQARIQALLDIIEEASTKTIVFVPYRSVLTMLERELSKHHSLAVIHGGIGKDQRDHIFGAFQKTNIPHVLLAQPAAMSHGLTLTAASTVVWYAPVTSNEIYQQANARISRPGQKHSQLIANIEASPVERRIYSRLKKRQTMQGLLLEIVGE